MMQSVFIALLFALTFLLEVSLIQSINGVIGTIPLLFMTGIVVTHRTDAVFGALWFAFAAILLPVFHIQLSTIVSYIVCSIVIFFLSSKLFATRSFYALIGLGFSIYTVYAVTIVVATSLLAPKSIFSQLTSLGWGLLFLIIGLYSGFIIARKIEQMFGNRFYIR